MSSIYTLKARKSDPPEKCISPDPSPQMRTSPEAGKKGMKKTSIRQIHTFQTPVYKIFDTIYQTGPSPLSDLPSQGQTPSHQSPKESKQNYTLIPNIFVVNFNHFYAV